MEEFVSEFNAGSILFQKRNLLKFKFKLGIIFLINITGIAGVRKSQNYSNKD